VLVESMQPCAVGTEVICEIPLPGGRRRLRGRVARMQSLSPAAVGLAIAFTELGEPDQALLSEAIGEDDGRTRVVQVKFEGMREPMRSRAQLTSDGLRLSTALPFLRLRSPVEVTFLSGPSNVQSRGLIRHVELDRFAPDGTPRLAVSVAFAAESDAEPVSAPAGAETSATSPGLPAVAAAPVLTTPVPGAPPAPAVAAAPEARGHAAARVLAVAAVVAIAGLGASTYFQPAAPPDQPLPVVPLVTQPLPPPAPTPAAPPPPAPPVVAAEKPQPPPPRPAPVVPRPLPPGTPGPTIESDGVETTAVVPVLGSTDGAVHYSLARRRGLAINLPRATSAIPVGLHAIHRDGLRFVWIRERAEGGIHVRFVFSSPPPEERLLELEDDAIRVQLRLQAPPVAGDEATPPSIIAADEEL
jgi:hypothetical protein